MKWLLIKKLVEIVKSWKVLKSFMEKLCMLFNDLYYRRKTIFFPFAWTWLFSEWDSWKHISVLNTDDMMK